MSGVVCAKAVIDNGAGLRQALNQQFAALSRQLGCMDASILLSSSRRPPIYPTEEQEEDFLAASETLRKAFAAACEPFSAVVNRIAMRCDPTKDDPHRARTDILRLGDPETES